MCLHADRGGDSNGRRGARVGPALRGGVREEARDQAAEDEIEREGGVADGRVGTGGGADREKFGRWRRGLGLSVYHTNRTPVKDYDYSVLASSLPHNFLSLFSHISLKKGRDKRSIV